MNRKLTNIIRFCMDECLPPLLRDSRLFMYPFFYFAYRGKKIKEVMDFKKNVYQFTPEQYDAFYNNLDTISRNRLTDLNPGCLNILLENISPTTNNLVDVGSGNGYLLKKIKQRFPTIDLHGFDIKKEDHSVEFTFTKGVIEKLPYPDKSFDIVTCSHVLEHILDFEKAISELKRITRKKLIIVVPCQRYFYYTLDEHVNFFPQKENLTHAIQHEKYSCTKVQGDWVYIGEFN